MIGAYKWLQRQEHDVGEATGRDQKEDMNTNEAYINNARDAINLLADIRKQSKMAELGQGDPVRPNQLVNDLYDVMQWIEANMKESVNTESVNTGDIMTRLQEGEIQQASAIVTAKTMVDRVGRWIEELSGMENDTLLQLGDSIRDEMGQEQAKKFIETVAPAIQSALENLKSARETLSTGVRALTGEEQPEEMLGAEPAATGEEDLAAVEPDAMNSDEVAGDEFGAADAATGGMETAGREQRESIDRSSRLLKVLAG
jgi:plasmid stabilization system protein ParE